MKQHVLVSIVFTALVMMGCATAQPVCPKLASPTPPAVQKPEPKIVRFEYEAGVQMSYMIVGSMKADAEDPMALINGLIDEARFFVEVKGPHPYYEKKVFFQNSKLQCKVDKPCKLDVKLGELDFSFTVTINAVNSPEQLGQHLVSLFTGEKIPGPFQLLNVELAQAKSSEIRWQEEKEKSAKGAIVVQLAE